MNGGSVNSDNRIEQFKQEVADLKVKTSGGSSESTSGIVGLVLMVVSVILGVGSYIQSTNESVGKGTTNEILLAQMNQNQEIILAGLAIVLALIGAALFLRVALVKFWRFWMLRNLYENQAHLDELVKSLK
jgi:hypothetical protein